MGEQQDVQDQGFTLVELLVVIIVLGILAAIAIPSFLNQRTKGYRAQALSDMKNAALAIETYATSAEGSFAGANGVDQTSPLLQGEGFHPSQWVALTVTSDVNSYCLLGINSKVPGKQFVLRSDAGQIQIQTEGSPAC